MDDWQKKGGKEREKLFLKGVFPVMISDACEEKDTNIKAGTSLSETGIDTAKNMRGGKIRGETIGKFSPYARKIEVGKRKGGR